MSNFTNSRKEKISKNSYENENESEGYSNRKNKSNHNGKQIKEQIPNNSIINNNPIIQKRRKHKYRIDPSAIPRPSIYDEVYTNDSKEYIILTNEIPKGNIPYSNSFYIVNESENSSFRFLRPSVNILPINYSFFNSSGLLFGFYFQPFAHILENEMDLETSQGTQYNFTIPLIEVKNPLDIFTCKRCECIINNKFQIIEDSEFSSDKKIIICNICRNKNILKYLDPGVKDEYMHDEIVNEELMNPTIEFKLVGEGNKEINSNENFIFIYHMCFIDISEISVKLNYGKYVANSLLVNLQHFSKQNIEQNLNSNKKKIITMFCIFFFDEEGIYFMYYDKKAKDIKIIIMKDIKEPYCPIPGFILFNNIDKLNEIQYYELLNEKIEKFVESKVTDYNKEKKVSGSAFSSCIYAAIDILDSLNQKGYNHLHIFSANKNTDSLGKFNEQNYLKKFSSSKEIKLFLPKEQKSQKILEILLKNKVALNVFYLGYRTTKTIDQQLHLPTFFDICTKSGGRGFYYSLIHTKTDFTNQLRDNLEKLHYDINSIFLRKYFYNFDISVKHSKTFKILETFFGMKNSKSKISLPSVSNDFNISFQINFSKILQEEKSSNFQFVVRYNDIYDNNCRKLRIFNSGICNSENFYKIYTSLDVDVMSRIIFFKETSDLLVEKNENSNCFEKMKQNIKKRIIDVLYFYKKNCSSSVNYDQLTLPSSIRYFPLYMNSLYKKPFMRIIKNTFHPNVIFNFLYELKILPLRFFSRILYPRMHRIDNIENNKNKFSENFYFKKDEVGLQHEELPLIIKPYQYKLSIDSLEFFNAFLFDDGININLIIFSEIDRLFIYENFGYDDFNELKRVSEGNPNFIVDKFFKGTNEIESNTRISNVIDQLRKENPYFFQPLKLILIDEFNCLEDDFLSIFIEDEFKEEIPYVDFLCNIHNIIIEKLKLEEDSD